MKNKLICPKCKSDNISKTLIGIDFDDKNDNINIARCHNCNYKNKVFKFIDSNNMEIKLCQDQKVKN